MDEFLAKALRTMNRFTADQLATLSAEFRLCLINNYSVFGKHSFRKHIAGQEERSVLNASLWDVMTTGLSRESNPWSRSTQMTFALPFTRSWTTRGL